MSWIGVQISRLQNNRTHKPLSIKKVEKPNFPHQKPQTEKNYLLPTKHKEQRKRQDLEEKPQQWNSCSLLHRQTKEPVESQEHHQPQNPQKQSN